MSYLEEDERKLLREFITWLANVGLFKVEDAERQKQYVDSYLKEREEARAWGKE